MVLTVPGVGLGVEASAFRAKIWVLWGSGFGLYGVDDWVLWGIRVRVCVFWGSGFGCEGLVQ